MTFYPELALCWRSKISRHASSSIFVKADLLVLMNAEFFFSNVFVVVHIFGWVQSTITADYLNHLFLRVDQSAVYLYDLFERVDQSHDYLYDLFVRIDQSEEYCYELFVRVY